MSTLKLPPHVAKARSSGKPPDFEWDDDDVDDYYERESPKLSSVVEVISTRGHLALAAACAEWVLWRLEGLSDLPDVRDFIEACWAGAADDRYLTEWTRPMDRELVGPVLGPQLWAARLLDEVLVTGRRARTTDDEVNHTAFLAQHVMKGRKAFMTWRTEAYRRAALLSPLSAASNAYLCTASPTVEQFDAYDRGAPIARAAFDTTVDYDGSTTDADLDAHLRAMDWERNRFLRSPDELRADGFEGEPYSWSG